MAIPHYRFLTRLKPKIIVAPDSTHQIGPFSLDLGHIDNNTTILITLPREGFLLKTIGINSDIKWYVKEHLMFEIDFYTHNVCHLGWTTSHKPALCTPNTLYVSYRNFTREPMKFWCWIRYVMNHPIRSRIKGKIRSHYDIWNKDWKKDELNATKT